MVPHAPTIYHARPFAPNGARMPPAPAEPLPPLDVLRPADLARLIDHTILKPDARREEVQRYCAEAVRHTFWSVCVNPVHVATACAAVDGTVVRVCSVVGFPFGAMQPEVKAAEALRAVADGASELDMVIDIGALKDGRLLAVRDDVAAVRHACRDVLLKVIIETCLLDDTEKQAACRLAVEAGADYVKTSTGFSTGGAVAADVALMRRAVGHQVGVKASGGIRDFAAARAMIAAGASRIGTSAGPRLIGAT